MEQELEALAGQLSAADREVLARKFYRWAKQLYVSAQILRQHAEPGPVSPPVCAWRGPSVWRSPRRGGARDNALSWRGRAD